MSEETKTTVAPTAVTTPVAPTAAEIEAKSLADKAAALAEAQQKYAASMQAASLALPESEIRKNNAAYYMYLGVGIGALAAGTGILLMGLKK